MGRKASAKIIVIILGSILTVLLVMLAVLPALNRACTVTVEKQDAGIITQAPLPDKPEQAPVTVYYVPEENSKKISRIYIEVFCEGTAFYMEIPTDTKVDLSEELYKSLQTYGPELPQHFKLANMTESFSEEYGLTAGNRILSEVLGFSLKEYVRTPAKEMEEWLKIQGEEKNASAFFKAYEEWISKTSSSRTPEERWTYYENRKKIAEVVTDTAPGSREKDGYLISSKRVKEWLEEKLRGTKAETEPLK